MAPLSPVLITEDAFHTLYLLEEWQARLNPAPILIRADKPANLAKRMAFLEKHAGKRYAHSPEIKKEVEHLFGSFSESEQAMVERYGFPELPVDLYASNRIQFIGEDLNNGKAQENASQWCAEKTPPQIFIFLEQMLKDEKWLKLANQDKIINAHSAVLPYAPGMHSIEYVAAKFDGDTLKKCAGSSVHYIDKGGGIGKIIDVSPIRSAQFARSIWHVKAQSYKQAFQQLTHWANEYQRGNPLPKGVDNDHSQRLEGSPFRQKDFEAPGVKQAAEENFHKFAKNNRHGFSRGIGGFTSSREY